MQRVSILLLGVLALALLAWWCAHHHGESIESDLTTRAGAAIAQLEGAGGVEITADGRDLTVSGGIPPLPGLREEILGAVRVRGVREVTHGLEELSAPRFSARRLDAGWALGGLAAEPAQRAASERAALWLGEEGGALEVDFQTIEPAAAPGQSPEAAAVAAERVFLAALPILPEIERATLEVTPERATLRGAVESGRRAGRIYRALADSARGQLEVDVDLDARFVPGDLELEARGAGERLIVSGVAPAGDLKPRLLEAARAGSAAVEDRLLEVEVEGAAPASFGDAFEAGLPRLAQLRNARLVEKPGEIELSGLSGEGDDPAEELQRLLEGAAPGARVVVSTATALEAGSCQRALDRSLEAQKILFASGRHAIDRASDPLLAELAATLRRCPDLGLRVEGHTDSDGEDAFNLALSRRRAAEVTDRLASLGVLRARLAAEGFGESRPIADNETADGKARNRRIEFILHEQQGDPQ
ncbi:MAG: OmpA family protein [Acidobacteriota bacterium]